MGAIRRGEIVERGILRGIGMGILKDDASNPAVFKLGQDFLLRTGFPWGQHSEIPGPPFLTSGTLMFYQKSKDKFNIQVSVKESPVEGFEFDAVASEDIPAGTPLIRQGADVSVSTSMTHKADNYHMSEDDLYKFLKLCQQFDQEKADAAGVEPDELHETTLRRHAWQTNFGDAGVMFNDFTVVLPHPVWGGFGVFACQDIQAGDVVEYGLMCQVMDYKEISALTRSLGMKVANATLTAARTCGAQDLAIPCSTILIIQPMCECTGS